MIKYPVVLILSEGQEPPENIVEKIRRLPPSEEAEPIITHPPCNLIGYKFHLTTKYYTTDLYLVPFKEDITLLPAEIQESTEGVLIYFDSGKRSFSGRIRMYADFLKENEIELGILLCDRLYDDSNEGITYKEAKQSSKFLDVIELGRTREEDEEDDPHDPLGYDELHQALRSFLWSNVQMGSSSGQESKKTSSDDGTAVADAQQQPTAETTDAQESAIDAELAIFEKLLTEVVMFKNSSTSWSRNERLAYAQKFADKFGNLIDDNSSDEG